MKKFLVCLLILPLLLLPSCGEKEPAIKVGMEYSEVISAVNEMNGTVVWKVHADSGTLYPLEATLSTDLAKPVNTVIVILASEDEVYAVLLKNTGEAFIVTEFSPVAISDAIKLVAQYEVWCSQTLGEYYKPSWIATSELVTYPSPDPADYAPGGPWERGEPSPSYSSESEVAYYPGSPKDVHFSPERATIDEIVIDISPRGLHVSASNGVIVEVYRESSLVFELKSKNTLVPSYYLGDEYTVVIGEIPAGIKEEIPEGAGA